MRLTCGPMLAALLFVTLASAAADNPTAPAPAPADTALETIVVQGQKLNVETKIDRKIYSVPEDAQSTLGFLSDILNVIPSVDVDPDGLLSLRGDSNVLVLIDGKPATQLQGSKAGDNLQSLSARDIERIEVLTTPPAQFKAEGAAGVINIITRKRGARQSASGSLQGSLGDGGRSIVGASGSYGSKTFTASLAGGYRKDYRQRKVESDVTGADPATGEILTSRDQIIERVRRNVPSLDFSAEYDPNDRQAISGSASWSRRGGLRTYTQLDQSALPSGAISSSTRRLSSGHDPENDYNATLRFTQKLNDSGETLDISFHRSLSHQHEHYDYVNDSFVPPEATFYNNLSFTEDHGITEADVDYTLPLPRAQSLKIGYAFEKDDYGFDNAGANTDPATGMETVDPTLTNEFIFHQYVHAIYQSYQASVKAWTFLAGLRTEWSSSNAQLLTTDEATRTRYFEPYPSLHIDRTLTDHSTLSFGASRRVTRPDPSFLDPYVDHEYTPNLRAGNPALKPQYSQSFETGYDYEGHGASYGLTAYYRRNQDSVTEVTEYLGNGFSLTTRTNLPRNDAAGLEFLATGHLLPQLSYTLSGNAFYSQIDASALGFSGLKSTTGLNAKAKLDYRPTAHDSAQITFTRTDKRLTPQGSISAINIVNLGYKHAITPTLSAVATVSDLFSEQHYERTSATPVLMQTYRRSVEGRVVFVGLSFSFGVVKKEQQPSFDYDSGGGGS
jgi:outer membrane receptor protein involved in Fe transport